MSAHTQLQIPEAMKLQYLRRRKVDVEKLTDALSRHDLEVFKRIGHQLKGNAATYGYLDLESIGIRLENSVDIERGAEALEALQAWMLANSVQLDQI